MRKETITYTDYNGAERTEEHYFNLNEVELMRKEASEDGSLIEAAKRIGAEGKPSEIVEFFENLILDAYGVKSADGRKFEKSQTLRDEFIQTQAYSALFMKLALNAEAAAAFINGIIPSNISTPEIAPAAL